MPVVDAVPLGAFPAADPARRLVLTRRVGVAHVAPEFRHVHAAVAVPLDDRGVIDIGIGGDELHAIPGGQEKRSPPALARVRGGDRRLRREVCARHVLDETAASAGLGGGGFAGNLKRLRLGLRRALKIEQPTSSNRRDEHSRKSSKSRCHDQDDSGVPASDCHRAAPWRLTQLPARVIIWMANVVAISGSSSLTRPLALRKLPSSACSGSRTRC